MTSRVLAIETDKGSQKRIRKELRDSKIIFADPKTALEKALREAPHVILLNLLKKGKDDLRLLAELQSNEGTRDIPIERVGNNLDQLHRQVALRVDESLLLREFRQEMSDRLRRAGSHATSLLTPAENDLLADAGLPAVARLESTPFLQKAAKYRAILATALTTEQAAARLGVKGSRIRQRLLSNPPDLYGIQHGNIWKLPDFQFDPHGLVPQIDKVIPHLAKGLNPVAVDGWFRREHIDLQADGKSLSPLDWLSQGNPFEPVADLAKDL